METNKFEKLFRVLPFAVAAGLGVVALSACSTGQVNAPTVEELREQGQYFELERPDGSTMVCWEFGARGEGLYGESPSWFSVTCDWGSTYTGELTTTTTSTTVSTQQTVNTIG